LYVTPSTTVKSDPVYTPAVLYAAVSDSHSPENERAEASLAKGPKTLIPSEVKREEADAVNTSPLMVTVAAVMPLDGNLVAELAK
jgi:hypothetical protein